MRIDLGQAYVPQVGDILSWVSGEDKILFVVAENTADSDKMIGISLLDTRSNQSDVHVITFHGTEYNYRLHLLCKQTEVEYQLDSILDKWRTE